MELLLRRVCCSLVAVPGSYLLLRASSSTASQRRHEKYLLLRKNRRDPAKEEAARKGKLLVPLNEIANEWRQSHHGLIQLETAAVHCGVFRSLFGKVFCPSGYMGVSHNDGAEVYQGNILYPRQVSEVPTVSLPSTHAPGRSDGGLYTLTLTNPDGNLQCNWKEVLHWMIINIPASGPVALGHTLYPYVPPLPPQGTGVHRMVFTLYAHTAPLAPDPVTDTIGTWLDQRTFSSQSFLSSHPDLAPFTIAFYQTLWDPSVSKMYSKLGINEPVYGLKRDPTPRRVTQMAVKRARQLRQVYL